MRRAWELDDAEKAEKLICNLAQRLLERDVPGDAAICQRARFYFSPYSPIKGP